MKQTMEQQGQVAPNVPFDLAKAEQHLREFVTPETWDGISSKRARERLEELMGLETGSLKAYKKEINAILNNIVVVTDQNVQAKSSEVEKEPDGEDEEPSPKKPRTEKELPKNLKKLQGFTEGKFRFKWAIVKCGANLGSTVQFWEAKSGNQTDEDFEFHRMFLLPTCTFRILRKGENASLSRPNGKSVMLQDTEYAALMKRVEFK